MSYVGVSYFGLIRNKQYTRVEDDADRFIYRLKPRKHWLEYKPLYNQDGWRNVWNVVFYDERHSHYVELIQ